MPSPEDSTLTRPPMGSEDPGAEPWSFYLRPVFAEGLGRADPLLGRVVPLRRRPARTLVVGRAPDNTGQADGFPIPFDSWASRSHARLDEVGSGSEACVAVEDLGSRNGTFVEGQRISGRVLARPGSILRVSGTVFVIGRAPLLHVKRIAARRRPPDWFAAWSLAAVTLWDTLCRFAPSDVGMLLTGETGTGKTRVAREIHALSPRHTGPFVPFNCSAIPYNLEEATLFGVVGGFIPSVREKRGWLTLARGGTLFLDELADMPLLAQTKLLDAFDTRDPGYLPVGGNRRFTTDCRLISATNRDVFALAAAGELRQDLLGRLVTAHLVLPPLRDRREDLLEIYRRLLAANGDDRSDEPVLPRAELAEAMLCARWAENIRGLETFAKRAQLEGHVDLAAIRAHADRGGDPSTGERPALPERVSEPPAGAPASPPPESAPWPPTPQELLENLVRHAWSVKEVATECGRRPETLSRLLAASFGPGGKSAAQRAWRVWQASGRIPTRDDLAPVFDLYFQQPDTAEVVAARTAWSERGVRPDSRATGG